MRRLYYVSIIFSIAATLAGCLSYDVSPPEISPYPAVTADVGTIEIYGLKGTEQVSVMEPDVEELATTWLNRRLQANQLNYKRLVIDIDEAYTRRAEQSSNKAFDAYTSQLTLSFKLYEPDAHLANKTARMTIKITRELEKDPSIAMRDTFFATMGKDLVEAMDKKIPVHLQQHLPDAIAEIH